MCHAKQGKYSGRVPGEAAETLKFAGQSNPTDQAVQPGGGLFGTVATFPCVTIETTTYAVMLRTPCLPLVEG